ncbi:MAG: glutamyl-tRNA reductase [Gammaproteobacteria bacterium]|nr:glutamyl-tRNA reductase [Gammaproteobacteria bacterium]
MGLLALGINHRTAPIELRERIAFAPNSLLDALGQAMNCSSLNELAILSTCNRTELYCATSRQDSGEVLAWLGEYHRLSLAELSDCAYEYWDDRAVRHILRVASGLDSMVLGEPQILGQLKTAYAQAQQQKTLGPDLSRMFQHAFSVAKQVRTDTEIGSNPVSVAYAAVSLAKRIFSDLHTNTVLLIGAGEMVELVARHFAENGIKHMIVANRTFERARSVAEEFNGQAILLEQLSEYLPSADIIVSCTASSLPILGKGAIEQALKKRKHRPMFLVDIAVPRDIEPQVGDLADAYLYTIDDLQGVIDENLQSRQRAATQAEKIIDLRSEEFMDRLKEFAGVDTLKLYRDRVDQLRQVELTKALAQLNGGADAEEVLRRFSNNFANKVMHEPSVNLKKASVEGRNDLLAWAKHLFGLDR